MDKLKQQFLEVSDALELGNPAIIEKDYWVVALLAELKNLIPEYHRMVFSGGTALAKSDVKIMRMSEDVDIKLIPIQGFDELSRSKKKAVRKEFISTIETRRYKKPPNNWSSNYWGEVHFQRVICFNYLDNLGTLL